MCLARPCPAYETHHNGLKSSIHVYSYLNVVIRDDVGESGLGSIHLVGQDHFILIIQQYIAATLLVKDIRRFPRISRLYWNAFKHLRPRAWVNLWLALSGKNTLAAYYRALPETLALELMPRSAITPPSQPFQILPPLWNLYHANLPETPDQEASG